MAGRKSIVRAVFRPLRVALLCTLAALVGAAALPAGAAARTSVVLAFWSATPQQNLNFYKGKDTYEPKDTFLRELEARHGMSIGFFSAIQGDYNQQQAYLDITQGSRQSNALYQPRDPIPLVVEPAGAAATIKGWGPARERAKKVSVTIRPGLLVSQIPGGAAYVGVTGLNDSGAIAAADEQGRVAAFSLGSAASVPSRTQALLRSKRFVAVNLPVGAAGRTALDGLLQTRRPGELLLFAHLAPTAPNFGLTRPPTRFYKLPALGYYDGRATGRGITSITTRQSGLVSSIDLLPTILRHLGVAVPKKARGEPIALGKRLKASRLEQLRRRWSDVRAGRQGSSLRSILALAFLVTLLIGTLKGLGKAVAPGLRIGALGLMWWPTFVLAAALFEPQKRLTESAFVAGGSIAAAAITDRLLPWPRGPLLPAAVALVAYTLDLALGTDLLTRSALGPSVTFGARFYGISNELEPLFPIMLLLGLAAIFNGREPSRRLTITYVVSGLLLGVVVGWGRLGADVGGVLTVGGGFTVATLVMLPGGITKRSIAIAALVPFLAIGGLVALDLLLSGGDHLTRNLTRSQGLTDLYELVARRYELAYKVLRNGRTPFYFLGAGIAIAFAVRNRSWLYAPLRGRVWRAALLGGLGAGIIGALTNDSGPVLLTNAVMALAAITAYVQGTPNRKAAVGAEGDGGEPVKPTGGPAPHAPDPVLTS